jgi:hypothetical protein
MPSPVDKYFKQVKDENPSYSDAQAWATAWAIFCKHKNPGSPHCHQSPSEYLKGKEATMKLAAKTEIELPHNETVKAVGKQTFDSGKASYWYQLNNGAKMSYSSKEKFRYQLRNQAQVKNADKLIEQLDKEAPDVKTASVLAREFEDALITDRVASKFMGA